MPNKNLQISTEEIQAGVCAGPSAGPSMGLSVVDVLALHATVEQIDHRVVTMTQLVCNQNSSAAYCMYNCPKRVVENFV